MKIGDFYVLYHRLGFLTFDKRSCEARATKKPNPRGFYSKLRHAQARKNEDVWINGQRYPGNEIEIRLINVSYEYAAWEEDDEDIKEKAQGTLETKLPPRRY